MPGWHPLLACVEPEPGVWVMIDPAGEKYGQIRFVRRGPELGYSAVLHARAGNNPEEHAGYYLTLRAAAFATHRLFLARHGGGGVRVYGQVR